MRNLVLRSGSADDLITAGICLFLKEGLSDLPQRPFPLRGVSRLCELFKLIRDSPGFCESSTSVPSSGSHSS
jgi:hypothetical protein